MSEKFLENSYLKQLHTTINKINTNSVIFDETIFYPSGGGQPHDIGFIKQKDNIYTVRSVEKVENQIIHYVDNLKDLQYGDVELILDWSRRYTFMRYHSLLHVFAGYLNKEYGALTFGNQIFEDRARIDIQFKKQLTDIEVLTIEEDINSIIKDNRQITSRIIFRNDDSNIDTKIKTIINLIPNNVEKIRLINIGDLDEQPCNGTHVQETKEIGSFQISTNKSRGKGKRRFELIINGI